jgi:hypothetical protein
MPGLSVLYARRQASETARERAGRRRDAARADKQAVGRFLRRRRGLCSAPSFDAARSRAL